MDPREEPVRPPVVPVRGLERSAAKGAAMPSVYLLRCADDSLYCGWTTDVERRLAAHQAGTASRYTRSRRPVALAAAIDVPDRSAALREEARIKRLPRAAKLALASSGPGRAGSSSDAAASAREIPRR
jgi:putative endonuclease